MEVDWAVQVATALQGNLMGYSKAAIATAIENYEVGVTPTPTTVASGSVTVHNVITLDLYKTGSLYWFAPKVYTEGGIYDNQLISKGGDYYKGFFDLTGTLDTVLTDLKEYKKEKYGWTYYSETKQS